MTKFDTAKMLVYDTELIREAVGSDIDRIAYFRGKTPSWVKRQYNTEFLNFWTNTKKWLWAFAQTDWAKLELFINDFEMFVRHLKEALKRGLVLPFPMENKEQLILRLTEMKRQFEAIDELLAV